MSSMAVYECNVQRVEVSKLLKFKLWCRDMGIDKCLPHLNNGCLNPQSLAPDVEKITARQLIHFSFPCKPIPRSTCRGVPASLTVELSPDNPSG
jgi:hypothetical protein